MTSLLRQTFSWHAGPPAWGPAMVAGFGCALPLLLGLFSAHPGFLWASAGAFQAAQANPLHRLGMLRMLIILGGLWVMLLAFGLRGMHGLRMWPYMPRFISIFKVLKRHAKRLPQQKWRLHALGCTLAFALSGLIVNLAELHRGYWLTLTVVTTLQLDFQGSLVRAVQSILASLGAAAWRMTGSCLRCVCSTACLVWPWPCW